MKRTFIALTIGAALMAGAAFAQDHAEYQGWMKSIAATNGSLRKTVEAKEGDETAASAEKLAGLFEKVRGHFEEHKMQDAIDFATHGHDAAMDLSAAAKAGEWDKASADLKTIGGTCQGCHAAHREKLPDGTFKMK